MYDAGSKWIEQARRGDPDSATNSRLMFHGMALKNTALPRDLKSKDIRFLRDSLPASRVLVLKPLVVVNAILKTVVLVTFLIISVLF